MKTSLKSSPSATPSRREAVIFARVSFTDQEKEGYSIPAQLKLRKDCAVANGLLVAQDYVDVETAKPTARNAQRLFAKQEPREKRRLLSFLASNCRWNDGVLTATFRQPFDTLAEAVATPIPVRTPEGVIPA